MSGVIDERRLPRYDRGNVPVTLDRLLEPSVTVYPKNTAQESFTQLYHEFSQRYATGVAAQSYAADVIRMREDAAHNYRQIVEAADRGEDVTTAVLDKLLPHANTEANRAGGVWIHPNLAVSGDVVRRHQRLGWTQPEEWPQKAAAILAFVRSCVENPADLAAACVHFRQQPNTVGFQSGTLSPILNALRPNLYITVNRKSLQAINHFAARSFSADLLNYPDLNAAGLAWVQVVREFGDLPDGSDLRAVDRFDLFCHWLVTVKQISFARPRIWQMRPDGDGQWDAWRAGGFVALGYDELGDLSDLRRADFNRLRDRLLTQNKDWRKRSVEEVWRFAHHLAEGDRIVVHNGAGEVLGIGAISGFYYYVPNVDLGHCRPVVWDDLGRRQVVDLKGERRSFSQLPAELFEIIRSAPIVADRRVPAPLLAEEIPSAARLASQQIRETAPHYAPQIGSLRAPLPRYDLSEIAVQTGFAETQLAAWIAAIERKGQAIFYGPPGTGKSFVAAHLARHLVGGEDGFIETIQFHAAYAYEDFVQGIRPVADADGVLSYRLVPGIFPQFCREAAHRRGRCVLLIDEINRADLGRVFGEVMQLLDYREQSLSLAGGGQLTIPANVRILGTMNTADRSIALVDAALRRRFAFLALYPDYDLLRHYHARQQTGFPVDGLIRVLRRINSQIADADYALGITPFLQPDLSTAIDAIWQTEIEPYLEEFFFDQPDAVESLRWSAVREQIAGSR
ncbi:MAG: AAA family ATPase [Caldilineaceae bacterium]|nr:AAA family ATPase [Caldilineaceae bacterium]